MFVENGQSGESSIGITVDFLSAKVSLIKVGHPFYCGVREYVEVVSDFARRYVNGKLYSSLSSASKS